MTRGRKQRVPQRTCIVCRSRKAKLTLLRLALDGENKVCLDHRKRQPGRGGYVCPSPECLARLKLSNLRRAFRRPLPETAWDPGLAIVEGLQSGGVRIEA